MSTGWMKRVAVLVVLAAGLLFVGVAPSHADGWRGHDRDHWHHRRWLGPRISVGVGPWGWGSGFWWGAPGAYLGWGWGGPPYYAAPPVVIQQSPPVYIQRPESPPPPPSYWYYCPSKKGYYPTVRSCPEPWVKVAPGRD